MYFWVLLFLRFNEIVRNNLIYRFWYHLVTISPILVKENGINNTQITTKLLNTSIGQFGYAQNLQESTLYFANDELVKKSPKLLF